MTYLSNKHNRVLNINVTFHKSPEEIADISKYWLFYGDIRVNEQDGVGYYKDNRYPFKSVSGKAFLLLCHLVKNHGNKLNLEKTYDKLYPEDTNEPNKKAKIKDYVKEIKKNLGITDDKKPTLDIMVIDDDAILISNPPIK